MSVKEVNEKLMKKVAKLLNLSTNNPNENESQNALLFAQKLMAENNISLSDLDFAVAPEKKEVGEKSTDWMKKQWQHRAVASVIADNFRCYYFYRTSNGMSKIVFLGLKADCELAKTMFEFAILALEYNADEYVKEQREIRYIRDSKPIKTDYMKGFINGLSTKFKKQSESKVMQIIDGKRVETSMALVLVKDNALVAVHDKMKFTSTPRSKGGRVSAGGDMGAEAFVAGKEKGLKFESATGYIK